MGKCFVDRAIDGELGTGTRLASAFDDAVDEWHREPREWCTLPEFLGMTTTDYAIVMADSSALDSVIERLRAERAREQQRDLTA